MPRRKMLNVFRFDRCHGELTLSESIDIPEFRDSMDWWPTALEYSPNNRFLYVFCSYRVFQFDLLASPISSSRTEIARFNFQSPTRVSYWHGQLAPDGKIYVTGGGSDYYVSVINNPDGQGASCGFVDAAIQTPTYKVGLPYYPNYRLGALPGSACDTLTSVKDIATKEKLINLYPNPATNYIIIDYGFTDWSKGDVTLEVVNSIGQIIYQKQLPRYSGFHQVDVSQFASGLYTATIKRKGEMVSAGRFVRE